MQGSFYHAQVGVKSRPSPWKRYPHPFAAHVNRRMADISLNPSSTDLTPEIHARAITLYHVPLLSILQSANDPITHHSQTFSIYSKYRIISNHPSFISISLNFAENSIKFHSKTYSYILCDIKTRPTTLSLQTLTMNCAGLYFTKQDILDQLSTLLQYFSNQVHSTLTHPLRTMNGTGCQYIFQGYFTDLCWILEHQETTCWIHSTCAKPARHSWTTNKFAHQWNVVTS